MGMADILYAKLFKKTCMSTMHFLFIGSEN